MYLGMQNGYNINNTINAIVLSGNSVDAIHVGLFHSDSVDVMLT